MTDTMVNSTGYVIAAYAGAGVLYGGYLLWLWGQERKLRKTRKEEP